MLNACWPANQLSFIGIQILRKDFIHGEHVNLILFEDSSHCIVTPYLALVARILEIMLTNILPYAFDSLWPRELQPSFNRISKRTFWAAFRLTLTSLSKRADRGAERNNSFYMTLVSSLDSTYVMVRGFPHMEASVPVDLFLLHFRSRIVEITVVLSFDFRCGLLLRSLLFEWTCLLRSPTSRRSHSTIFLRL